MQNELDLARSIGGFHVDGLTNAYIDRLTQRMTDGGTAVRDCRGKKSAPPRESGVRSYLLNAGPGFRYIVKLYDPDCRADIGRELDAARRIATSGMAVPSPFVDDLSCRQFPVAYRMTSFVEGYDLAEGLATGRLDDEDHHRLGLQLARCVSRLAAADLPGDRPQGADVAADGKPLATPARSAHEWTRWCAACEQRVRAALRDLESLRAADSDSPAARVMDRPPRRLAERALSALDALRDGAASTGAIGFVHGGLSPEHIIVDDDGLDQSIVGCTGLRHAMEGDPLWDVARLQWMTLSVFRKMEEGFMAGWRGAGRMLEASERERIRHYALLDQILVVTSMRVSLVERERAARALTGADD